MQKKIIALAVAGLMSGAAFAQSNVTVYGIVDANVISWSGNGMRSTGVGSGGLSTSRLGFKGAEDLGNGLKAVFNLEAKVAPGGAESGTTAPTLNGSALTGAAPNSDYASNSQVLGFDRQANVGLTGGFGTVLVGTMSTLSDSWMAAYDYAGNFSARLVLDSKGNPTNGLAASKPVAVAYVAPSFSGLTLGVANIFGEQATSATRVNVTQFGANYGNGPISVAYTYTYNNQPDGTSNVKENQLGGSYDFGAAKVLATWANAKNDTQNNKLWQLGVVAPVGKGNIHAGFGKKVNDTATDTDVKFWSVAYSYGFSKRTTGYVGYGRLSNGDASSVEPHGRMANTDVGQNYNGIVVGLRHGF